MDKTSWTPSIIYRQWGVVCSRPFDRCVKLIERKAGLVVASNFKEYIRVNSIFFDRIDSSRKFDFFSLRVRNVFRTNI